MDKKELRKEIRAEKKRYSKEELILQSTNILAQLEEDSHFKNAEKIMLYASLPDEVQTLDFINKWKSEKTIILPTVAGDDIIPVRFDENTELVEGEFNIPEPQNNPYLGDFDLIVVPGMAFDNDGNRLGRGKGYYDRFLELHPQTFRIGICFDFQLLPEIPHEKHDKKVHKVISFIPTREN